MKQTNGALTLLLKAYRSVFRNAYFKGIASAVVLTAGLSAGAANADNLLHTTTVTDGVTEITITGEASNDTADGEYGYIQFTGSMSNTEALADITKITVQGGDAVAGNNLISDSSFIANNADFIIEKDAGVLVSGGSAASGSLVTNSLDIQGNLKIQASAGHGAFATADTIKISGIVDLESAGETAALGSGSEADGKGGDAITLNGGTINLAGSDAVISGKSLEITDGVITASGAGAKITTSNVVMNGGYIIVDKNVASTLTINLASDAAYGSSAPESLQALNQKMTVNDGHIIVGADDQIKLANGAVTIAGTGVLEVNGLVTIGGSSTTQASLTIANDSGLQSVGTGTNNQVTVTSDGTLNISERGLLNYLSNTDAYTREANDELELSKIDASTKGKLHIASGGATLNFTSDVDLNNFTFNSRGDATAGEISVNGSTTDAKITADGYKLVMHDNLELAGSASIEEISASHIVYDDSEANHSVAASGWGDVTATSADKVLEVIADPTNHNVFVDHNITLNTAEDDDEPDTTTAGQYATVDQGTIKGNGSTLVVNNETLSVTKGAWSTDNIDLAIGGANGELKVVADSTDYVDGQADASLTVNGKLNLISGSVTVGGSTTAGIESLLDLSSATLLHQSVDTLISGDVNVTASGNGTIIMKASDFNNILADTNSMGELHLYASGGTFEVNGSVNTNSSKLTSGSAASSTDGVFVFDTNAGGILDINGDLTLVDSTASGGSGTLDIGSEGVIYANSINFTNEDKVSSSAAANDDLVTFKKGTFVVSNGLSTGNDKIVLGGSNGGDAQVYLNAADSQTTQSVSEILEVGEGGKLNVAVGNWTVQEVNLESTGSLTVGATSADAGTLGYDELDEELVNASLNLNALTAGASSQITVNEYSSAVIGYTDAADAAFHVSGDVLINGADSYTDADAYENTLHGVNLEGAQVTVTNGATFEVAESVLSATGAFSADADAGTLELADELAFTANLSAAGPNKVKLNFAEGNSFTTEQLADLRTQLGTNGSGFIHIGQAAIAGLTGENGLIKDDNEIAYDDYADFKDILSDITSADIENVGVTDIDAGDALRGSIGYAESNVSSVETDNDLVLNNAQGNDTFYASYMNNGVKTAADISVAAGSTLSLQDEVGGQAGRINLVGDSTFGYNTGVNTVNGIEGVTGTVENIGTVISTDNVSVGSMYLAAGDSLTLSSEDNAHNDVTVAEDAYLDRGSVVSADTFTFNGSGDPDDALYAAGTLDVNSIVVTNGEAHFVGNDSAEYDLLRAGTAGTLASGVKIHMGSSLTDEEISDLGLSAEEAAVLASSYVEYGFDTIDLNGATLYLDPAYGDRATVVAGNNLDSQSTTGDFVNSVVDGTIVIGQNSVMGLGTSLQDTLAVVQDYRLANGSLNPEGYGSILYVAKSINVASGQSINIDSTADQSLNDIETKLGALTHPQVTGVGNPDFYMSSHAAVIIDESAFENGTHAAINYADDGAVVFAEAQDPADVTSKIILNGDSVYDGKSYQVFADGNTSNGIEIVNDIYVESQNKLFQGVISAEDDDGSVQMNVDRTNARAILRGASDPVFAHLMKYATRDANYAAQGTEGYVRSPVTNGLTIDTNSEAWAQMTAEQRAPYTVDLGNGIYAQDAGSDFLDVVINTGNGQDAETVARLAVYGGAAEVAMAASSTTYEAINTRMGMGNPNGNLIMADNANGAGLWLAPIYKNHESDSFDAQGVDYGVDLDLYGVALGADYTFGSNIRAGAMFNVGSGDADGQGAGSAVSNDFDYWSAALYAGYAYENFSVVADVTYTAVDNDIDANTAAAGKVTASTDADVFTIGATAQYKFELDVLDITPHLGLRYTGIDIDDYTVKGNGGVIALSDVDSTSVFSIPVGVTFSKDITAGEWNVKPVLDLTVTANTGDDEVDSDVYFDGVDLTTDLSSEFMDSVTYGAALGLQVQKDSFQFGLGVNYVGSENTDEYGVSANARFTF